MFDELNNFKRSGHFLLRPDDNLASVCNAPKGCSGIYIIFGLQKAQVNLIYIGISGRKGPDGKIKHRKDGLRGRFLTGKQFGALRKQSWPRQMKLEEIDALDIYWYVTHDEEHNCFPKDLEDKLLQQHKATYGSLPRWNKKLHVNMKSNTLTISNLRDRFKYKQLQLDPPYQRRSVWKTKDRVLLLSSVFNGIPIPAIIFHKHYDKKRNRDIYDVLDGKQRLETILHFIGLIEIENEGEWTIKIKKNPEQALSITYADLLSKRFNKENNHIADKFWSYEIPVIEYEGELRDFFDNPVPAMDVFVRINSTGSPLKKNEIRHASSAAPFFKLGENLEKNYHKRFIEIWKIFSENEVRRYVFHEYLLELCTAIYFQNYTDKRKKLEELIYNHTWKESELTRIRNRFNQIIVWMRSIFSDDVFSYTRFRNKSDFYSLFVVLNDLIERKFVFKDAKANRILGNTLLEFSKTAQEISSDLRSYDINKSWKGVDREVLQYVIATRQSTDSLKSRQIRNDFIQKLLKGFILKTKDSKRIFDENTKGILWTRLLQRYKIPKCPNPMKNSKCKKVLSFDDAQVDHLHPWTKGGPTTLKNAQLICSSCNKNKSAKT